MENTNKKVAIILAGCGVYDGSEIHETCMAMLALTKHNIEYDCFAPDIKQAHVINHCTGEIMQEERNVLIESARIARGAIKDITELNQAEFDGLLFPGGFGAAKNLSDFAFNGKNMKVLESISSTIKDFHKNKKPIAALCIAPTIIAQVLGAKVTIGNDIETAAAITNMGGKHENKNTVEVCIDSENKIVTTPCYMLGTNIYEIAQGCEKCIIELNKLL